MWSSLNATLDPDHKRQLLDGELFRFKCSACGGETPIVYPMLYHDMERRFMIWMCPPDAGGKSLDPAEAGVHASGRKEGYVTRRVTSVNDLLEKILTFDSNLNDLTLEMVKLALTAQMQQDGRTGDDVELHFAQIDRDDAGAEQLTFALVTPTGASGATVAREPIYSDMSKAVAELSGRKPPPAEDWPRTDAQYLLSLMQFTEPGGPTPADQPPPAPSDDGTSTALSPHPARRPKPWWKLW
jgi:hypothetical protein